MGTLFVVATPIGNLKDMTFRAIDILKTVDYVLCEDTRVSLKLFKHFDINNKLVSYHKFNENERIAKILTDLNNGMDIALISDAGTPCISDPGFVIVKKVREAGISVLSIGGISAFVSALSSGGISTDNFIFYGFFPRENKDRTKLVKDLKDCFVNTIVFYESPKRIVKTLEYLYNVFGNIKISVFKEITKIHEKNYYGLISDVIEELKNDDKVSFGEYTFIIEKKTLSTESRKISLEGYLVDEMIQKGLSLKDAVNSLNDKFDDVSKKDIYNAGLNLKNLL